MKDAIELQIEGRDHYEQGDMKGALGRYLKLLEQFPDDPEVLNDLGAICFSLGKPSDACRYLLRALRLDESHPEALTNLYIIQQALGLSWTDILNDFLHREGDDLRGGSGEGAPDTDDEIPDIRLMDSGVALLCEKGQLRPALALARARAESDRGDPEAWNDLAVCAFRSGDLTEATAAIRKALILAPADGVIHRNAEEILHTARRTVSRN